MTTAADTSRRRRPRDRWDRAILVGTIVAVLTTGAVAVGMVRARNRVHRAAISSLGNYAAVAAEQFVNGVENTLRQSFVPILPAPGSTDPSDPRAPLPLAELVTMMDRLARDPCQCNVAPSPSALFRLGLNPLETEVVDSVGRPMPGLDSTVVRAIAEQADSLRRRGWRYGYLAAPSANGAQFVFFTVRSDVATGRDHAYGLTVPAATMAERVFKPAFEGTRLIPRHLLATISSNQEYLALEVATNGVTIYTSPRPYPNGPRDALVLPPLRGAMTVTGYLNPQVKNVLIAGGVPPRLPTLELAMLGLSLALLLAIAGLGLRAADLARLRSDFASSVTHELRTPLTQIRLAAETVLLGRATKPGAAERSLRSIVGETNRLQQLIDNVLHFSRTERRMTRIAKEPVDLLPFLRQIADGFSPLVAARRITLVVTAPAGLVVAADPSALRQILLNLLDNAARYGPDGQSIVIGAEGRVGEVRLWVDDQGAGIPPNDRTRIWQPFVRLTSEADPSATGTGLGLSVVRDLIDAHGGRGWIEDGPRGGTRIVLGFP